MQKYLVKIIILICWQKKKENCALQLQKNQPCSGCFALALRSWMWGASSPGSGVLLSVDREQVRDASPACCFAEWSSDMEACWKLAFLSVFFIFIFFPMGTGVWLETMKLGLLVTFNPAVPWGQPGIKLFCSAMHARQLHCPKCAHCMFGVALPA